MCVAASHVQSFETGIKWELEYPLHLSFMCVCVWGGGGGGGGGKTL